MRLKVLILTASYGSGHVVAAKALDEAFRRKGIEPVVFDMVLEGGKLEKVTSDFYEFLVKHGHYIWRFYHKNLMPIRRGDAIRKIHEVLYKGKFFKEIEKVNPDVIVATMDTASLVSSLYARKNPDVKIYTVITDYVAHPMWIWKNMNKYFVGSEVLKRDLISRGVNKEKIFVTGIPLRLQFENEITREEARKKLKIPQEKLVILASAGTFGSVPIKEIFSSISSPLETFAIVLAGKKAELVSSYAQILQEYGVTGRIVEYTDNMNEYMRASDLFISKAGGVSVAECFAAGLGAVYTNNFPGHETGNASYAQTNNAALIVQNTKELKNLLEKLLQNKETIKKMGVVSKKLGSPDAAVKIVAEVIGLR